MKLDLKFSENAQTFDATFKDVQILHDEQNGATFTPSVSIDGIISWTNDKELPNPDPVNIKGEKGEQGDKGDKGDKGEDGHTPVKGVDYFTETDKAGLVSAVIDALPVYDGEVVTV